MVEAEVEVEIRLCKKPDSVCLQGGCLYCSIGPEKDHLWRTAQQWKEYAQLKGMLTDWAYGQRTGWPNREKRERHAE